MHSHSWPWELIFVSIVKLLKAMGILPGALAAFGVRKWYQKWRQDRAAGGWPATDATIHFGESHKEGPWRTWVEITYTYYAGEYRTGKYIRRFRREADADEFIRQVKDKRVHVHYDPEAPDKSVIQDRDLEMVALLAPQYG